MLTRNAKRIFSDNVTWFEQTKAARIGVICQGASSAPQVLLARLQEHSFQFVFHLVFPAYTLQLPSISALPTAFKKLCSNIRGSGLPDLTIGWWEICLEQVGICPTCRVTYLLRRRMKVPHLMSIRPPTFARILIDLLYLHVPWWQSC